MSENGATARQYVAIMTFGISRLKRNSPALSPFYPYVPKVLQAARASPGFTAMQPDLGPMMHPRFYDDECREHDLEVSQVLFLWENLESVIAFSYSGIHQEALRANHNNEWFRHERWPSYAVWWTRPSDVTWAVGSEKLERLHSMGPTADAFDFRNLFGPAGGTYNVNSEILGAYKRHYGCPERG